MASITHIITFSEFSSRDEKSMTEYARAKFNSVNLDFMYFGELKVQNNMVFITSGYLLPVKYIFKNRDSEILVSENEEKKYSDSDNHCSSDFDEEAYDRRGREGHGWSSSIDGFTNDEVDSYNERVWEREHGRGFYDM